MVRRPPKKLATAAFIVAGGLMLLWALLIATPMWVTRWRMAHLLADFHDINPTQSTWFDTQRLSSRWKRWSTPTGVCTSSECIVNVYVRDPYSARLPRLSWVDLSRINASHFFLLAYWLGYRPAEMDVGLEVQDGHVVRTYASMLLGVIDSGPPDHFNYALVVNAYSRSNLSQYAQPLAGEPALYGGSARLDLHPDYLVSRPSGCTSCETDHIAYTPTLAPYLRIKLTSFDLSCLTRWRPCTTIGDLLPFGAGWHLWEPGPSTLTPLDGSTPVSCHTEPRALARDAATVVEAETLSQLPRSDIHAEDTTRDFVTVRVLHVWKAALPVAAGNVIQVSPFSGESHAPGRADKLPEHLVPGHRVILFLPENDPTAFAIEPNATVAYRLDRCGSVDDTPANLASVQQGIAEDITYRKSAWYSSH